MFYRAYAHRDDGILPHRGGSDSFGPNDGWHQLKIGSVNHPDLNTAQNCHHNSAKMTFHVKVLSLVIIYLIYKEGEVIYTSLKSVNEMVEVISKTTSAIVAGLGAIYGVLAGMV
ncbi:hypothetical protein TWF751_007258 [Orbilia oligospora]|nr:hypothetical protein TWF751_007258 [Orbilia oligospora]